MAKVERAGKLDFMFSLKKQEQDKALSTHTHTHTELYEVHVIKLRVSELVRVNTDALRITIKPTRTSLFAAQQSPGCDRAGPQSVWGHISSELD